MTFPVGWLNLMFVSSRQARSHVDPSRLSQGRENSRGTHGSNEIRATQVGNESHFVLYQDDEPRDCERLVRMTACSCAPFVFVLDGSFQPVCMPKSRKSLGLKGVEEAGKGLLNVRSGDRRFIKHIWVVNFGPRPPRDTSVRRRYSVGTVTGRVERHEEVVRLR